MAKITTSNSERVFSIKRWRGVNENPDGDTKLKLGEASVMQNYKVTSDGSLQKRPGSLNVAGLMKEYTVAEGPDSQELFYDGLTPSTSLEMYPAVSVSDTGLLSLSGQSSVVTYANHTDHVGLYFEDEVGKIWRFAGVDYDDGVVEGKQQYRWDKWSCTSKTTTTYRYRQSDWEFYRSWNVIAGEGHSGYNSYSFNSLTGVFAGAGGSKIISYGQTGTVYEIKSGGSSVRRNVVTSAGTGFVVTYHDKTATGPHASTSTSYSKGSSLLGHVYGESGAYPEDGHQVVDGTRYWFDNRVVLDGYSWLFVPVEADFNRSDDVVRGIWSGYVDGAEHIVAACNGYLWALSVDPQTELWEKDEIGTLDTSERVSFFGFSDKLYVLNGTQYKVWDGTGYGDVKGYRPIVAVAAPPAGGGTTLEQVNKLTAAKRQWFSPAGSAKEFQLRETDIQSVDWVKENGAVVDASGYTADLTAGKVTFNSAPSDGTNTVEIAWTGKSDDRSAVLAMTHCELYSGTTDNRVFLYGDGTNRALYSGLEHETGLPTAEYFPDLNVMHVGGANTPITSLVRHYNRMLAFKEDSAHSIYYDTITLEDGTTTAGFYISPVNRGIGNVAKGQVALVENHPRSLDGRSLYEWVATSTSGNVTGDQRNAKRISQRIETTLGKFDLSETLAYYDKINHEYYLLYNGWMLVQNTETDAWYVYDNLPATAMIVHKGDIYFGTNDGYIRRMSRDYLHDNGEKIVCYWESGSMDFGADHMRKYSPYLWLGIKPEAYGEINVTVQTDRQDDYSSEDVLSNYTGTSASGFFSFFDLDFTRLSFNLSSKPQTDRLKIKVKKFVFYKLIFSSSSNNTTATVTSANISVRFMGKVR